MASLSGSPALGPQRQIVQLLLPARVLSKLHLDKLICKEPHFLECCVAVDINIIPIIAPGVFFSLKGAKEMKEFLGAPPERELLIRPESKLFNCKVVMV